MPNTQTIKSALACAASQLNNEDAKFEAQLTASACTQYESRMVDCA